MKRIFLSLLLMLILPAAAEASEKSYIVVYKNGVSVDREVAGLRAEDRRVPRVYDEVFAGAQVMLDQEEYREMRRDPRVRFLERDGQAQKTLAWGIDRLDQRSLPLSGTYTPPSTGAGTRAYIVDTGIRSDHREFRGRMLPGRSFVADGRGTEDCDGHGTHVAGTVAGSSFGVAPEASLVPVRVLGCDGYGSWSGIIDALDWIAANHEDGQTAVANMSLGGDRIEAVNMAVERLVARGVPVAVAAGNENDNACYYSPASAAGAWTVGSTTSSDSRSSFSNWGSCLDVFAPGSGIPSAFNRSDSDSATLSGTSMASPHVAGALLLIGDDVSARATEGILSGVLGSPNLMLHLGTGTQPEPPTGPANDHFRDALPLQRNNETSTVLATRESGEPQHVHSIARGEKSVWYSWTAPIAGTVTLSTAGSDFDTLLAVYRGDSLQNLSGVVANDDGDIDFTSRVGFVASAGTTYHIAVDGYGGRSGNMKLERLYVPFQVGISEGPPVRTRSSEAEFVFSANECSLDGAPWTACVSPLRLEGLAEGTHVFRVRYEDEVHSWSWTIDRTVPTAPEIVQDGNRFLWEEVEGMQSFCMLGAEDLGPCSSPLELAPLRPGQYRLLVWQEDELGNRSENGILFFTVSAPENPSLELRIVSAPPQRTASRRALFVFEGTAPFRCRIDRGAWRACGTELRLRKLRRGKHRIVVRDKSGSRQVYRWRIIRK